MQLQAEIHWTPSVRKLQNWSSLFLTEKFKLEQQESEIVTDLDRSRFDLEISYHNKRIDMLRALYDLIELKMKNFGVKVNNKNDFEIKNNLINFF
jgi:hypothetical protein